MKSFTESEIRARLSALSIHDDRERISIEGFHTAGVLMPIVLDNGTAELLFTKRTELVETHKGQISFPGFGSTHSGDSGRSSNSYRLCYHSCCGSNRNTADPLNQPG
ncbi:MAG: hypothetical protein HW407_2210 [Bacteroidetes bacterium]|nr:hypothetical protein [Bacteroidota bacterium]